MHADLCHGKPGLCEAMKPTKGTELLSYLRTVEFKGEMNYLTSNMVSQKSSWRFPTDGVKSKYISVTSSRIHNTRRAFERSRLKLYFALNLIEIGIVYQKLFKFKNEPE